MLEIVNIRDGAVLDRHDGRETADALEVVVKGLASPQATVTVNGIPADRDDRNFSAKIRLTRKINRITAASVDAYGERTQTITVIWDKGSFRRYNFFIDDCIFFLRNVAVNRLPSLFDDHFLRRLREIHGKYGSRFTLNLFFHDDHHDFSLTEFPGRYRREFQENSDWLKLSFHAKSEFPDRPYQSADAATLAADFDEVRREVCRFAGPECFIAPMVIHWAMTNPENFPVLSERGVRCLAGGFLNAISHIGESHSVAVTDIGFHYEQDVARYICDKHLYYDRRWNMFLLDDLVTCNYATQEDIRAAFAKLKPEQDTVNIITHEQYCYPDYFNYIPDHLDRIELACRLADEAGYKPVFFNDGLLGNPAWENCAKKG